MDTNYKELVFRGQSESKLARLAEPAKRDIGFALWFAQTGKKASSAKPLGGHKEFKGGKVLEIVSDFDGDTYRSVYTIEYEEAIYVLDAFKKKSKRGIATPQEDIERIIGQVKALRQARETPEGKAQIEQLLARQRHRQAIIDQRKARNHEPE
jgi:phage-related protein